MSTPVRSVAKDALPHIGHILLVEPDADYASLIQIAFGQAGAPNPFHMANTEQEAMEYLCGEGRFADPERYPLPALILLALPLQIFNDFELLRWIRQQPKLRHIPVFVLSGIEIPGEERRAHQLGSDCYSEKPAQFSDLVKLAAHLRDRWLSPLSKGHHSDTNPFWIA